MARGRATLLAIDAALLLGDETADAGARLAGDDKTLPLRGRRAAPRRHYLDLVAVLQLIAQRHKATVDLGADAGIANLTMDGIGEIDRGRAARKLDKLALRREAEDLVAIEFELGIFEELVRRLAVVEDLEQILHPAETLDIGGHGVVLLVVPMRGNAFLGDLVHLEGADLDFDLLIARLAQRHAGMQTLVTIGLGRRDIVFEAPGDHREGRMHGTQCHVAIVPVLAPIGGRP